MVQLLDYYFLYVCMNFPYYCNTIYLIIIQCTHDGLLLQVIGKWDTIKAVFKQMDKSGYASIKASEMKVILHII